MTELILLRHGQTDWNLEGRYQGQADTPLNATGRRQAEQAGKMLITAPPQAIYASDLSRAIETAQIVARQLGTNHVQVDTRLREVNQGAWEGLHVETIQAEYPEVWAARKHDPLQVPPPGGESVVKVAARVLPAADDIARRHPDESVLIVSHGVTLALLICQAGGHPLHMVFDHIPPNAQPVPIRWIPA